jgi:hypothetical protein
MKMVRSGGRPRPPENAQSQSRTEQMFAPLFGIENPGPRRQEIAQADHGTRMTQRPR